RNMRLAFHTGGFFVGGARASLMMATRGAAFGGRIAVERDAEVPRAPREHAPFRADGRLTFAKLDAVFKSGNATRDTMPSHLLLGKDIPPEVAEMYEHMCPAGVYERVDGRLVVNPSNCVDCKATDVLGPRWTP